MSFITSADGKHGNAGTVVTPGFPLTAVTFSLTTTTAPGRIMGWGRVQANGTDVSTATVTVDLLVDGNVVDSSSEDVAPGAHTTVAVSGETVAGLISAGAHTVSLLVSAQGATFTIDPTNGASLMAQATTG